MSAGPAAAPDAPAPRPPTPPAGGFRLPISFWLWVIAAGLLTAMSILAAAYDRFPGDEPAADALQGVDLAALDAYFDVVNVFGDTFVYFFAAIVAIGVFVILRLGGEAIVVALTFIPRALNGLLKEWVERPRPSDDLVEVSTNFGGFSFPSGHTVASGVLFGALFFLVPRVLPKWWLRLPAQAVCLLIVVGAGPARVHLGAHWPSDVIGGYLVAFLFLLPVLIAYKVVSPRLGRAFGFEPATTTIVQSADTNTEASRSDASDRSAP